MGKNGCEKECLDKDAACVDRMKKGYCKDPLLKQYMDNNCCQSCSGLCDQTNTSRTCDQNSEDVCDTATGFCKCKTGFELNDAKDACIAVKCEDVYKKPLCDGYVKKGLCFNPTFEKHSKEKCCKTCADACIDKIPTATCKKLVAYCDNPNL